MFKIFKYLKLIGLFKNCNKAYKEHTGKDRPPYLSRRFVGAMVLLGGTALSIYFGVEINKELLNMIIDNIEKIIGASVILYGVVMEIVGIVKRERR